MNLAEAYSHCGEVARAWDRDRWLGALFAPSAARPCLHALIALEAELSRIAGTVREPRAGELRLVWWRETVTGGRGGEAQAAPIAAAVLDTLEKFRSPPHLIENAIAGRQFDLYDDPFPDVGALEAYLGETHSGFLQIAAIALAEGRDIGSAEASGLAGVAIGLIELMRGLAGPRALAFVPRDTLARAGASAEDFRARRATPAVTEALGELLALARRRLGEAEVARRKLPKAVAPAYAALATAPLWLAALERAAANPFGQPVEIAAWRRQWALWRWSRRD